MQQYALVTVYESYVRITGGGGHKARVVRDESRLVAELRDVDRLLTLGPDDDRELDRLVSESELCEVGHWMGPLLC